MKHAPFSPSAAKRWTECIGSFALSLPIPNEPSSQYAEEGNRLHDVAESVLMGRAGMYAADDMAAVEPYVVHCSALVMRADVTGYGIEERIEHSALLFGTPDFYAITGDTLHVVDLKTGSGVAVSPIENAQLLTYAYMILKKLDPVPPKRVCLTIVQPPVNDEPVHWAVSADEVMAWGDRVETAMQRAISGEQTLSPGEHCRWCKAKPICPKLRGDAVAALAGSVPTLMAPRVLASWLDKADTLQQFIEAIRTVGHAMAVEGNPPPGWMLKPKRATRQWADEEAVLEIARRRKIKIWQDKLMSPAMAEKAHPNMPEELTRQIVAISSGVNLVRDPGYSPEIGETPASVPLASALKNLTYRK